MNKERECAFCQKRDRTVVRITLKRPDEKGRTHMYIIDTHEACLKKYVEKPGDRKC